jgi:Tol biopolymer transport system component
MSNRVRLWTNRDTPSRLSFLGGRNSAPVWTPGGRTSCSHPPTGCARRVLAPLGRIGRGATSYPAGPGRRWQISTGGVNLPVWSHDGRELLFETLDQRVMAVSYADKGDSFAAGKPQL